MSEKLVTLTLDIFAAAELRSLLEIARTASPEGSFERKQAENMLDYLRRERWRQVPFKDAAGRDLKGRS